MAAAMAGGKGKGKKKWSKGKVREKVANKVLYDQETYERLLNEVPKVRLALVCPSHVASIDMSLNAIDSLGCVTREQMKLITASAIVERLKVNAALARASIHELEEAGTITRVLSHHQQLIFTRAVGGADE